MLKNSDFPHEDQCLKEKLRNVIFDLEKGNKEKIISKSVWCFLPNHDNHDKVISTVRPSLSDHKSLKNNYTKLLFVKAKLFYL